MADQGGAGGALVGQLRAHGVTVLACENAPAAGALEARVRQWLAEGPIAGLYWLPALDVEPALEALDLAAWREANRVRVKNLYTAARALYGALCGGANFLVAATRLGGLHGYGPEGAAAPLGGAVTGFAKAYQRERPQALVKAVDFEAGAGHDAIAEALIAETLADPGAVEIGHWQRSRYTLTLADQPARDGQPGLHLGRDTVFVVTGAAGGITSAIVADLAAHSAGTFYLLDLALRPEPGDEHLALLRESRERLKQCLIGGARAAGERLTPAGVEKQLLSLERQAAALGAVEAVEAAGGTACYHRVDLLDGPAVAAIVEMIRQRHGRIDVLIHAAGVDLSRALSDKDPEQFNLVYDVKVDGLFNVLRAARGLPIGAVVAFSSVAGRFGNGGQTDYSAANDLLCKLMSSLRRWRPETRGLAIDWTAWGGLGMATRGSIPKLMEMAGIEVLPPEAGVPTVRRELTYGGGRGEVVVAGRLGVLAQERDETGGLDPEQATGWAARHGLPMIGRVQACRLDGGLEVETTLDPRGQPFLRDHALEGTPLLPGVMGIEALAEAAALLAPGYVVAAVDDVRFENPLKFYRHEPRTLRLSATLHPQPGGDLLAHTTLRSTRQPARLDLPPQEKLHVAADVRLTRAIAAAPRHLHGAWPAGERVGREAIYQVFFHGPAYQVLAEAYVEGNTAVGRLATDLPPDTVPEEAANLMAPRLIELGFQTAGVWEIKTRGALALPRAIGTVAVYRPPEGAGRARLYAVVEAAGGGATFTAQVVDEAGNVYVQLSGYRTVALAGAASLTRVADQIRS